MQNSMTKKLFYETPRLEIFELQAGSSLCVASSLTTQEFEDDVTYSGFESLWN